MSLEVNDSPVIKSLKYFASRFNFWIVDTENTLPEVFIAAIAEKGVKVLNEIGSWYSPTKSDITLRILMESELNQIGHFERLAAHRILLILLDKRYDIHDLTN